ncbi:MAG TPA: hypothetical protein VFI90_12375 [Rubrobacter sp.]|nr:hypothetical protein [Rubrobacter sp.]
MKTAVTKVIWVGRATVFLVGLSVILALIFGVASTALGANGDPFKLGKKNVATAVSTLLRKGAGPALRLQVASGQPPLVANAAAGKATNLDADKIDGQDVTQIGVNGLQRIEVESPTNNSSPKQVSASCPTGKVLVGTGFDVFGGKSGSSNEFTHVIMDFVIPGSTSVTVAAYEDGALPSDATWRVKAIAICATAGTT